MFQHCYDREVFKLCIDVADDILNFIDPDTPEDDIVAACAFKGCLVRREFVGIE